MYNTLCELCIEIVSLAFLAWQTCFTCLLEISDRRCSALALVTSRYCASLASERRGASPLPLAVGNATIYKLLPVVKFSRVSGIQ